MPANRPTSAELLDAVHGFLKTDVLPKLEGTENYHLRVALNALNILMREAELGPGLDDAERKRLGLLLGHDGAPQDLNTELCGRIQNRTLTYKDGALIDHLLETTLGKMSIDNPKYATYTRELSRK